MAEYKRSFDDELDWNLMDQLHKVVLQIGTFCFRTKQICITVDIAVIGLLVKFTNNKVDTAIFVAGFLIPLCFWFLDSIAFYYQVKIRSVMENIRKRLRERNEEKTVHHNGHIPIIDGKRGEKPQFLKIKDAFFNHSMWMYGILIIIDITLWIQFRRYSSCRFRTLK